MTKEERDKVVLSKILQAAELLDFAVLHYDDPNVAGDLNAANISLGCALRELGNVEGQEWLAEFAGNYLRRYGCK